LKACLAAKDYAQPYGIDYDEKFSPIANIYSVCVLISLAANLDWPLFQSEAKIAFLHENLHESLFGATTSLLLSGSIRVVSVS
jgi:hypothetical protein